MGGEWMPLQFWSANGQEGAHILTVLPEEFTPKVITPPYMANAFLAK